MASLINNFSIDWESKESHFLVNPKWPEQYLKCIENYDFPDWPGHIWVASSGSSSERGFKLYALSKAAFLSSAEAVNEHLALAEGDIWLNVLPKFHVGGLAIFARCHLAKAKVIDGELKDLATSSATITSLVPTQVFDLVKTSARPSANLRAVIVGGGSLSPSLYSQARDLGWPLLPSFGMTECCSQIATADLLSLADHGFPQAKILKHIQASADSEERLTIESLSLFTGFVEFSEQDQRLVLRQSERYATNDKVSLAGGFLNFKAREDDVVKILGELINLNQLTARVTEFLAASSLCPKALMVAQTDERRGNNLVLALPAELEPARIALEEFCRDSLMSIERPKKIVFLKKWPEAELGKPLRREIVAEVFRHDNL